MARPSVKKQAPRRSEKAGPPAGPSEAEKLELVAQALESAIARLWRGCPTYAQPSIDGVSVQCAAGSRVRPHWHLVTNGLAARGFELSLKVPRPKEELTPPAWALLLLSLVVRTAKEQALTPPSLVPLTPGALGVGIENDLTAFSLSVDRDLGLVGGAALKVPVLTIVGMFDDEVRLSIEWSVSGLLEVYGSADPLMTTDLERSSLLLSPRTRTQLEGRVEREGSSTQVLTAHTSQLEVVKDHVKWTLDAPTSGRFAALLKGRVGHGRGFEVRSRHAVVEVVAGEAPAISTTVDGLRLKVDLPTARAMRALLRGRAGTFKWDVLPQLTLSVVDTLQ